MPVPGGPHSSSGLKAAAGSSATWRAAPCARRLEWPMTKVSKVSAGSMGSPTRRGSAGASGAASARRSWPWRVGGAAASCWSEASIQATCCAIPSRASVSEISGAQRVRAQLTMCGGPASRRVSPCTSTPRSGSSQSSTVVSSTVPRSASTTDRQAAAASTALVGGWAGWCMQQHPTGGHEREEG